MARSRKTTDKRATGKRRIEQYDHKGQQRKNNPPVGLVTEATDRDAPKHRYAYDPHLDPTLTWAGKAEHTSFEVPAVSLHVHERIDSKTIVEAVRRRNGTPAPLQGSLFESADENPPLREAIDFYQHAHAWSNRLIAGDSLLVMNSLLEKEGMAGKVQMVYIDPPYGIRYGSNFQPFVNKRDVKGRAAVSRIVATLKGSLDVWLTQPLAEREVVFAYLDALMLRVRSAGKVVSAPVLAVVGVLADGQKVLLTLELCSGGESYEAWKGCLDGLRAADSTRRCSPLSTATRGCGAPLPRCGPGQRCNAAVSTSCATWSARPRSTRWPKCGRIFMRSSTPPVPRRRRPRGRSSNGSGASAAPASSRACRKEARSC